jgi:hypothetical protein
MFLVFSLIFSSAIFAQIKTNYEIIDSLVSESINQISENLDKNSKYSLKFTGANEYSVFKNRAIKYFQNNNISLANEGEKPEINYSLDNIKVDYPELYRDGFLGGFIMERKIQLSVTYLVSTNSNVGNAKQLKFLKEDNVPYSNAGNLENISYSFTSAKIPEEPFFSSILEPVVAIGTAAVAVYLFFNLRSK